MNYEIIHITGFDTRLIDELTAIEAEAFGDGGLNKWTFPVIIRHGAVFVLMCDDQLCGVADVIRSWADSRLAFLINFVIKEEERGKGLGYRFLSGVTKKLKDDGINRLQLTVDPRNERAVYLYQRLGFRQVAELESEYGPLEDRLLYELELEG